MTPRLVPFVVKLPLCYRANYGEIEPRAKPNQTAIRAATPLSVYNQIALIIPPVANLGSKIHPA